jgi:hypothetical protein
VVNLTVSDRVCTIATFRFVEVRLMELLARWTPTTPEMEAKVLFGRHIWLHAQHADILGKRTFELRRPEHYTLRAAQEYVQLLDDVAAVRATDERISAFYDGILPGLHRRYSEYVAITDSVLDEPTVVLVERILGDLVRERAEAAALRAEIGLPSSPADRFVNMDAAIGNVVAGEERAS